MLLTMFNVHIKFKDNISNLEEKNTMICKLSVFLYSIKAAKYGYFHITAESLSRQGKKIQSSTWLLNIKVMWYPV